MRRAPYDRALHLRLALLTYGNAVLVYFLLTRAEADTFAGAVWKVVTSLYWLLPVATPFALVFALAGAPVVRRVLAALHPRGRIVAGAAATLAFLVPAATIVELALAQRDGFSVLRWALQIGGGIALAVIWALLPHRRIFDA
ncbi:hypothetical protein [Jannaschia sp. 2305UL9-9]|uniref:hypothetical protein n=1 Tax=Jannaschia sp. 2305UL9-9 TaxID=3121638 RepID=UPI0035273BE4